jgi:hypothetical protein
VSAAMPSTAWQQYPADSTSRMPQLGQHSLLRFLAHPLTVICGVQAALSLSLVWSNTAYIDEADYLWIGHLEIAHWLHGSPWPSAYAERIFSGSPLIYPPVGALADSIGGLAGARILSLAFMLGTTVLLYFTAVRLTGRRGAVISAALWALSEPAIRLAFATYDPLSVMLTALSAWFIVQSGYRSRRGLLVAAAAASLALANATAYSGIVIDPVVIGFAFLAREPGMWTRRAAVYAACLTGGAIVFFGVLMTVSHSLSGLLSTVIVRSVADYQGTAPILDDIWGYSGMIMILAIIGSIVACSVESRPRAALLVLLGSAAFIVPAAQLNDQTAWSIDKHLAYGIWFASIAAGYGCDKLIHWLPGNSRRLAPIFCVIGIVYISVSSWQSAWNRYHAWPNASAFISDFKGAAARSQGLIYVPGQEANIAEYYTVQGRDWERWSAQLLLDPATIPQSQWESYYEGELRGLNFGVVALFYPTTFASTPELPEDLLLPQESSGPNGGLLSLEGENAGEPGLPALTLALEKDPDYGTPTITGIYDSTGDNGIYAIWLKKSQR